MIIIPITSFITACGFALAIAGSILPQASFLFARSCELSIFILLSANAFLISLKGAYYYIETLPVSYMLFYYAAAWLFLAGLNLIGRFLAKGPASELIDKPSQV